MKFKPVAYVPSDRHKYRHCELDRLTGVMCSIALLD